MIPTLSSLTFLKMSETQKSFSKTSWSLLLRQKIQQTTSAIIWHKSNFRLKSKLQGIWYLETSLVGKLVCPFQIISHQWGEQQPYTSLLALWHFECMVTQSCRIQQYLKNILFIADWNWANPKLLQTLPWRLWERPLNLISRRQETSTLLLPTCQYPQDSTQIAWFCYLKAWSMQRG